MKQKIAEVEETAERDHQLRLAAGQEAKVSNLVFFIVYATHLFLNSLTVFYCLIGEGSEC